MKTRHSTGYTLFELLTALAVFSILMGIAIPAVSAWQERQQLQSLQAGLFHMTSKARYLAMTSHNRVTLCPLTQQGLCQQSWSGSISSFTDINGNRRLDAGEDILGTLYLPDSISLYWRGMMPNNSIHFSSQGVTFVSNGTMSLCPARAGARTGAMVITRQGRIRVSSDDARCP